MPEESILGEVANKIRVARSKATFDINEDDKRAREILAKAATAAEFDAASAAAAQAENVLAINKGIFSPDDARQQQDKIDELKRYVELKRSIWERKVVNETRENIAKADAARRRDMEDSLRRDVARYSADARAAMHEKKYELAMELLDKVLKIDPDNLAARDNKYVVQQVLLLRQERGYAAEESLERQKQAIDIRDAEIPWYELLKYPKDWREITARREPYMNSAGAETEQNRAALQKLKRKLSEAKFEKQQFQEVVKWLRDISGVNINVKWESVKNAGVLQDTIVEGIQLTDVTVEKALRTVLENVSGPDPASALTYVVDEGVVTVSTKSDLSGPRYRQTRTYSINDLIIAAVPPTFCAPRFDLTIGGGSNNQCSGNCNIFNNNTSGNCCVNAPDRGAIVNGIMRLIANTVDKESWMDPWGTGNVGSLSEMNGQLVITQTPENHRAIMDLISQLREAKALQITIECRFLSVSTGFLNTIGLDLQVFLNIGSQLGAGGRSAADPSTGATVPISGTNVWQANGQNGSGNQNFTPIALRQDTSTFATKGLSSPISAGIASIGGLVTTPSLSVSGTFLDDIQVDYIINATQANQMARSVTAPRLTVREGVRSAYVTFGTQQAYVASLVPIVSDNVVAYTPTVSSVGTGTVLTVDDIAVSADRRYVMMTISPQINQLNGFTTYFTSVTSTDSNGTPLTGTGFIQLPNVTIQDIRTQVSIPDGGTLLLGGQRASGELEREKGVPLLSKIPIIDRLFTNRGKVRDEQTILILVKPRIIIQSEEENKAFPP
jgi:general secretion pathway protein D